MSTPGGCLMRTPFRGIGRRLRRYVLPLVGFWHLLAKLEELRDRVTGLEATNTALCQLITQIQASLHQIPVEVAGRFDALANSLTAQGNILTETIIGGVDRLDSYLCYHAAMLQDSVAALRTDHAAIIRQGTTALRADLVPLQTMAQRPQSMTTAPGVDALVVAAGFDLLVPTTEVGLLAYILRHGFTAIEPGVRSILRNHLKPGAVVVDAGANIGIHTIAMASAVGPSGSVICFEPLPHLAKALERTLNLNGFSGRARVRQMALSDTTGEATLYRAAHAPMSSLFPLTDETGAEPITVPVGTLDNCFAANSRVDLVKMDVEGAEPRVWRGMRRILADNRDIQVILEWSASHFRRSGEDPQAFMAEIRAAGFSPFTITDDGPAGSLTPLHDGVETVEAGNLFLTRRPVTPASATAEQGALA